MTPDRSSRSRSISINSGRSIARARAAARARARDDLRPGEIENVRELRGELGAALRGARTRRAVTAALQAPRAIRESVRRPRRLLLVLALIAAAVIALAAFFLLPSRVEDAPAGGAPIVAVGATPLPTALRGRSTTPVPVVVVPTPPPTTPPSAAPSAAVGVPGGTGTGGAPGGIVETTRFIGRVIDSQTGSGVAGVCIVLGVRECSENPVYSDATGLFEIRLPSGSTWDINFARAGYATAYRQVSSTRTQSEVSMGSVSITRR